MSTDPKFPRDALCRDMDPELFFPLEESAGSDPAKAVCAACPVREACLEWALSRPLADGVFGGLTADERRSLRARSGVSA